MAVEAGGKAGEGRIRAVDFFPDAIATGGVGADLEQSRKSAAAYSWWEIPTSGKAPFSTC